MSSTIDKARAMVLVNEKDGPEAIEEKSGDAAPKYVIRPEPVPKGTAKVQGYDFNKGVDYDMLFKTLKTTGFQATNFGRAIDIVNKMISWRLSDDPQPPKEEGEEVDATTPSVDRTKVKCTLFLGFTSNMVSSGVREVIRFLCQHNMVQCICTTGGAVEEDIMKTKNPHYVGSFKLKGKEMRLKGQNRLGNLIVPNKNYCDFEDFMNPILDDMLKEQKEKGTVWSPSLMIDRMGREVDDESSVWYWCHKNKIPVFCPAITDGSVGDMIFFRSYQKPGLVLDLVSDIIKINELAMGAEKTGMVILGGGVIKHHILNANLMRNGADFSVFINTGQEFDGSDSGASPDEAVSWGKIKIDAESVKVSGDASLLFPLLVSQTFAKTARPIDDGKKKSAHSV